MSVRLTLLGCRYCRLIFKRGLWSSRGERRSTKSASFSTMRATFLSSIHSVTKKWQTRRNSDPLTRERR
jgi:hypothetical protein